MDLDGAEVADLEALSRGGRGQATSRSCSTASSRRAGCRAGSGTSTTAPRRSSCFALAEAVKPYYQAIVDAGHDPADRRARTSSTSWTLGPLDRRDRVPQGPRDGGSRRCSNAISGLPEEQVRLHFCWGSWPGPHSVALPLEKVLDLVYAFPAQCYSIEAAKPNHTHEWRAFEQLPASRTGKIVMPGVIDHTTPVIEHPQVIADRIVDLREGRRQGERHRRHRLRHAHRLARRVGQARATWREGAQLADQRAVRLKVRGLSCRS